MAHTTVRQPVTRFGVDGHPDRCADTLAVEEPLEIRIDEEPFTVTMRTPGHDLDLALGFVLAEGAVRGPADVVSPRHCPDAARDSAPSSLGAELAASAGMTLVGFSRVERFSVYAGAERIVTPGPHVDAGHAVGG